MGFRVDARLESMALSLRGIDDDGISVARGLGNTRSITSDPKLRPPGGLIGVGIREMRLESTALSPEGMIGCMTCEDIFWDAGNTNSRTSGPNWSLL